MTSSPLSSEDTPLLLRPQAEAQSPTNSCGPRVPRTASQAQTRAIAPSQLIPILFLRVSDNLSYVVVFPYIVAYITSLPHKVPLSKIGLYAGIGEGSLMVVEALGAVAWAKIADLHGRKRTLVGAFSLALVFVALTGFGRTVWWIIIWHALAGLSPCAVLLKLIVVESTDPSKRTKVLAFFTPFSAVGQMLGSLIGGQLADPFGRVPLLGDWKVWKVWPYALPGVVCTTTGVMAITVAFFFLQETRPPTHQTLSCSTEEGVAGDDSSNDGRSIRSTGSLFACLRVSNVKSIMVSFTIFQLATFAYDALFTVFTYTSIEQGGLGLSVQTIGILLFISQIIYILLSPIVAPYLESRLGLRLSLRVTLALYPLLPILLPLTQHLTSADPNGVGRWIVLGAAILVKNFGFFAWPLSLTLWYNAFDDHPHLLASASALHMIGGAGGRATGPAIGGWSFSLSTQFAPGTLGRWIPWITLFILTLPPFLLSPFLPPDRHPYPAMDTTNGCLANGDTGSDSISGVEGRTINTATCNAYQEIPSSQNTSNQLTTIGI